MASSLSLGLFAVEGVEDAVQTADDNVVRGYQWLADDRGPERRPPCHLTVIQRDAKEYAVRAADDDSIAVDRGARGDLTAEG